MLDRITFDPEILGGRACIRGMRLSAAQVVKLVASGMTSEEILSAYPYLEAEDIQQALEYAAEAVSEEIRPLPVHS